MDRRFWITLSIFTAVGPLSFLRKLDSLKYTSLIALFAVAYLVVIVVYHYITPNFPPPPPESIEYFHLTTKIFAQLPVFIFAFTCHQNVRLFYFKEEEKKKTNFFIYTLLDFLGL